MAYLVAWMGFNGRQLPPAEWQCLIDAARARVPKLSAQQEFTHEGASFRFFATKVWSGEPDPIRLLPDGRILLADARFPLVPAGFDHPQDDPAAVVIADPANSRITLMRDRLGQQPLIWVRMTDGVLAASKESILLAHPDLAASPVSDEFIAAHLANINSEPDATLYRDLHAVPPGARVDLSSSRRALHPCSFEPDATVHRVGDASAAAMFFDLLDAAVVRTCTGLSKAGVALSSGLDSSTVARLAASRCDLRAVAFGTQAHGTFDERPLAARLCERLGIPLRSFDAADHPPSLLADRFLGDPGFPFINPCRALSNALYSALRAMDVDVYLTGDFADFWSAQPKDWLSDALVNRRFDIVGQEYRRVLREQGFVGVWREPGWRALAKRMLGRGRPPPDLSLFRPRWREYLIERHRDELARFSHWPHPDRAAYNLGSFAATDAAYAGHYRDLFGLQARHPFRDWNLLRFCLSLPAYHGYREGRRKWIARRAMQDLLGAEWVNPAKRGGVGQLYEGYWTAHGAAEATAALRHGEPLWTRCLDPEAIAARIADLGSPQVPQVDIIRLAGLGAWSRELGIGGS